MDASKMDVVEPDIAPVLSHEELAQATPTTIDPTNLLGFPDNQEEVSLIPPKSPSTQGFSEVKVDDVCANFNRGGGEGETLDIRKWVENE